MLRAILVVAALAALSALPVRAEEEGPEGSPQGISMPIVDVGLDPGHSDVDVGAVGGGLREADLNLVLALRVRELLEQGGLTVAVTRLDDGPLTDFSAPDPTDRVRLEQEARVAAAGNVRVYVSLHFNGFGDSAVRGAETYYNGANRGEESSELAGSIHERLLAEVRAAGYALPDRGAKEDLAAGKPYGHFFSLRGGMPSVLVESMFLTNPTEASLLHEEAILDALAQGIAGGIQDYLASTAETPGS